VAAPPARGTPDTIGRHTWYLWWDIWYLVAAHLILVVGRPILCGSTSDPLWRHTWYLWWDARYFVAAHLIPCGGTHDTCRGTPDTLWWHNLILCSGASGTLWHTWSSNISEEPPKVYESQPEYYRVRSVRAGDVAGLEPTCSLSARTHVSDVECRSTKWCGCRLTRALSRSFLALS
jgi:hypothetical protein